MPYKDPNKQREFQRNWQRKRRGSVGTSHNGEPTIKLEWRLSTADDLKSVLETIVSELMCDTESDLCVRGRVIASLLTVGVRLLEVGSIEERLERLETKMLPVSGGIRK